MPAVIKPIHTVKLCICHNTLCQLSHTLKHFQLDFYIIPSSQVGLIMPAVITHSEAVHLPQHFVSTVTYPKNMVEHYTMYC